METDGDLKGSLSRLKEIAAEFYKGSFDEDSEVEVQSLLSEISSYIYGQQQLRPVQVDRVNSNISSIQRIFGSRPEEGHYPIISNHIDNLLLYSGAEI